MAFYTGIVFPAHLQRHSLTHDMFNPIRTEAKPTNQHSDSSVSAYIYLLPSKFEPLAPHSKPPLPQSRLPAPLTMLPSSVTLARVICAAGRAVHN